MKIPANADWLMRMLVVATSVRLTAVRFGTESNETNVEVANAMVAKFVVAQEATEVPASKVLATEADEESDALRENVTAVVAK